MSKGIGGIGRKVLENDKIAVYEYSSYNLNDSQYRSDKQVFDGMITIEKNGLIESGMHRQIKGFFNSKNKLIIKDISLESLLSNGKIKIENCKNCWKKSKEGYDFIALYICNDIFKIYQRDGELPEISTYNV